MFAETINKQIKQFVTMCFENFAKFSLMTVICIWVVFDIKISQINCNLITYD